MNGPIHVCTGYLAARALGYREYQCECLFLSMAALAPDFDFVLSWVSPFFTHGIWTHTLVGMVVVSSILALLAYWISVVRNPPYSQGVLKWFYLALIGGLTHLGLDAFTYYYSEVDRWHHMYFWPISTFPVHINTMVPYATLSLRVWIEVIYSICVCVTMGYLWLRRGENPFRMFLALRGFISPR